MKKKIGQEIQRPPQNQNRQPGLEVDNSSIKGAIVAFTRLLALNYQGKR